MYPTLGPRSLRTFAAEPAVSLRPLLFARPPAHRQNHAGLGGRLHLEENKVRKLKLTDALFIDSGSSGACREGDNRREAR